MFIRLLLFSLFACLFIYFFIYFGDRQMTTKKKTIPVRPGPSQLVPQLRVSTSLLTGICIPKYIN